MMTKAAAASAVAALVLMVSGCGSGNHDDNATGVAHRNGAGNSGKNDQRTEDARMSQAISDEFLKHSRSADSVPERLIAVNRTQADCLGDGWVDRIGTSHLEKYGLLSNGKRAASPAEITMSSTDAKTASGILFGCTDIAAKMRSELMKGSGAKGRVKRCIEQALTTERLRAMFTAVFAGHAARGQKQLTAQLTAPSVMRCARGGSR